jgi:hypothetical protein
VDGAWEKRGIGRWPNSERLLIIPLMAPTFTVPIYSVERCGRQAGYMDFFPGSQYQIDAETLRALYRMSNQLNQSGTMTPDEARNFAQRMKGLLRKAEQVE